MNIWEYGKDADITNACVKTLQFTVNRNLNSTQYRQQACPAFALLCTHFLKM